MRLIRNSAIFWAVTAVSLSAAAVWEEKPFTQWSAKDVEKVLADSPWAGKASITHEKPGADLGPVPDWKVIISVRSATPIRQATARQQLIAGGTASPELEANLAAPHPRYAFAIAGIPQFYRTQLPKSAQIATMKLKGKSVMATEASVLLFDKEGKPTEPPTLGPGGPGRGRQEASTGVQIVPVAQRGGGGGFGGGGGAFGGGFGADNSGITATLFLEFPKADPITQADGEVEVSTVVGGYQLKRTFKLKEMVYQGALAF